MSHQDQVTSLPGLRKMEGVQFSGYASVNKSHCKEGTDESLFYWFAGTEDYTKRPTILWTNGGPGSSSFWGFFVENGPFQVGPGANYTMEGWKDLPAGAITTRPTGWNHRANYLIFEHPLSVTLSKAEDADNIPKNVGNGIDQLYEALLSFLAKHPEVAEQEILIAGESYGGTYVPLLVQAIQNGNANGRPKINLKGQFIASGWVHPEVQQKFDSEYAFTHGLINQQQKEQCDLLYDQCQIAIKETKPGEPTSEAAAKTCMKMADYIYEQSGRSYRLNILQEGDPGLQVEMVYLNRQDVRDAIHAKSTKDVEITGFFSNPIYNGYLTGLQNSYASLLESIVNGGLQTMIVSGLDDGTDVNFLGVDAYLKLLQGPSFAKFQQANPTPWYTPSQEQPLGSIQKGGNFSWVKVVAGGHMCVRDQPKIIDLIMKEFWNE